MTLNERQHAGSAFSAVSVLLILFAASGFSALIYEVIWYQLLQFVIGATAVSMTVLLATFMAGLCLGSIVLPRFVMANKHHPLRVYAAIELGIGVCGVLVLFGMPLVSRIYVAALGHGVSAILLRSVICSICLLVPTMLMGASLPAVARWIKTTGEVASWVGLLYSANTAGAVFGALFAGFYLLRVFDMTTATFVAALTNICVAVISFGLSLGAPNRLQENGLAASASSVANQRWLIYLAIGLSGAGALGAEVVWTRLLGLILGATVYTFSIILAVFLGGLALGSGAGSVLWRFVRPQAALGYCQLLLMAAIAWTAFALAKSLPYWPINPKLSISPWLNFKVDFARAIWALLPPAVFWGASFALALAAVAASDADPARPVAAVYVANTCGAILGALTFNMLLIPHIGTQQCDRALIGLSGLSALCVLVPAASPSYRRLKTAALWLASATATGLLAIAVPKVPGEVIAYGRSVTIASGSQILYAGEGLNSSIAVSKFGNTLQFHVSGKAEASTGPYDMRVQRMLGDLPALLHSNPLSALVFGFGAGVTAGSLVVNPDIQRIVICEIEPLVPPTTTRYFGQQNYNVLHDRRTKMVYDDARDYILTTPEKFDIITSDPIHPWVKGSAAIYTKEYFELVRQHLNLGGVVAQWVPLYETNLETVKSEIATFFAVFPNGTIWGNQGDGEGYDVVLLGQAAAAKINVDQLQGRLDRPEYARVVTSLREVGLDSAFKILETYAGQGPDLKSWLRDGEINRDGNLRLQYLAGLAVDSHNEGAIYDEILRYRRFPANVIEGSDQYVEAIRHTWE